MLRVLKPGGRLVIHDTGDTDFYADTLRKSGAQDVTLSALDWLWLIPSRTISARKAS
jgi:ubiquinone/menaquinone biosynthesis C-methylase UbiE